MRTSADIYTDFSHLTELKRKSRQDGDAALKEAAKQFEAMFLQMVLKQMRQASPGDPIFDSDRSRFYQELHDQQLALHLSQDGGVGIAEMIVRQLGGQPDSPVERRSLTDDRVSSGPAAQSAGRKRETRTPHHEETGTNRRATVEGQRKVGFQMDESRNSTLSDVPSPSTESTSGIRPPARFETPQQFIQSLLPMAKRAAAGIGIDPKLLLAQAALETGWGKKIIQHPDGSSSHNLFNIKAGRNWGPARVQVSTLEYIDGIAVRKRADFRAYEDYQKSFEDYVELVRKPRYAEALRHAKNPEQYLKALQNSGYATDPDYANKILAIYRRQTLASL